jgi:hypothetical protein
MARWRGSTTRRGYGSPHQKRQNADIARWQPGDVCTRCGQPMWHRWMRSRNGKIISAIHLAHTPDRSGYEGLQHAQCNTSEGATRGNRMRGQRRAVAKAAASRVPAVTVTAPLRTSRQW